MKNFVQAGLTLVELLVVLLILSILASVALPFAEITIRRNHELELNRSLRLIRSAIDSFHEDWLRGHIDTGMGIASEDGYPKSLEVLVWGVGDQSPGGRKRVYLRRVPRNPFTPLDQAEQWLLRSYQDQLGTAQWGGQDVYDVQANTGLQAIDGSYYRDW